MKAIIIGGGIIGLCTAHYLHDSGWEVTVMDKRDFKDNCSYGNLGMIVPSHFVPLAAPGIVSQGIRWMFSSKSPFYVKPALNKDLISWGLQFIKHAKADHVAVSAIPLRDINLLSRQLYDELAQQPGFDFGLQRKGILMYYKTAAVQEEEAHLAEQARAMGLDAVVLDKVAIQQLEPQLQLDVLGGVHYRCDAHLYPNQLMQQLLSSLKNKGVHFLPHTEVTQVETAQGKVTAVISGDQRYAADMFIMAGGSWAPALARLAGERLLLMPGKGYSVTLDAPAVNLNIPAILCEARVALTPMRNKLRFGGTMEVAAVNDQVNMSRVAGIVESVQRYFGNLPVSMPEKKDVWFGFRPCSADGLPFIGFSKRYRNLLLAGGHSMMGLSLGPATGKLLTQLANGEETSMDISPFSPQRNGA